MPPGWSPARARARASATRWPATRRCALWLALRDASVARLAEVERAARDYLGEDVEAIGRDELIARLRRGDIVLVDVRPRGGVRGRPHRGRTLDPARRARASASPSCPPTARSSPTAAARSAPTRTRRSAACRQPAARRAGSRTAGPNGGSGQARPTRQSRVTMRGHDDESATIARRRSAVVSATDIPVDVDVLREEIHKTYTDVSTDQDQDFIFPTGRAWAQDLGYPEPELVARARRDRRELRRRRQPLVARPDRAGRGRARPRLRRRHRPADRRADDRPGGPRRSAST